MCGDAGPDRNLSNKFAYARTSNSPNEWIFEVDGLAHQAQLSVKSGMELIDRLLDASASTPKKYFASLSEALHVWRDGAVAVHKCVVAPRVHHSALSSVLERKWHFFK